MKLLNGGTPTGILVVGALARHGSDPVPAEVAEFASALGARLVVKCTECHRPLTDPESRARKIGPDCWDALHATPASTLGLRADYGLSPDQLEIPAGAP